ncbi:hypothetical protein ES706_03744 [subsurface metagenome]
MGKILDEFDLIDGGVNVKYHFEDIRRLVKKMNELIGDNCFVTVDDGESVWIELREL